MSGKYFTVIIPGYSLLWTKDLPYKTGTGEATTLNIFSPNSARPIVEGEWLQLDTTAQKYTRGGDNVVTTPDTPDGEGTVPAFPYFLEGGNYVGQASQMCHVIRGPGFFEFRTKLCRSAGLAVNSYVSVWDWNGGGAGVGAYGVVRRVVALRSAGYPIGMVSRLHGTDDIDILFGVPFVA